MDGTACLRLATRLHFMLRRKLDQEFEIDALIQGGFDARAALRLCRESGDAELMAAAQELERAHRLEAKASARRAAALVEAKRIRAARRAKSGAANGGHKKQDLTWARDTSGFGLSLPPAHDASVEEHLRAQSEAWPTPKLGWLERLGLVRRAR